MGNIIHPNFKVVEFDHFRKEAGLQLALYLNCT